MGIENIHGEEWRGGCIENYDAEYIATYNEIIGMLEQVTKWYYEDSPMHPDLILDIIESIVAFAEEEHAAPLCYYDGKWRLMDEDLVERIYRDKVKMNEWAVKEFVASTVIDKSFDVPWND